MLDLSLYNWWSMNKLLLVMMMILASSMQSIRFRFNHHRVELHFALVVARLRNEPIARRFFNVISMARVNQVVLVVRRVPTDMMVMVMMVTFMIRVTWGLDNFWSLVSCFRLDDSRYKLFMTMMMVVMAMSLVLFQARCFVDKVVRV